MRHRRAERLLLRAEAAADAGFFDEARAALVEARNVAPHVPGLAEARARIEAAETAPRESPKRRIHARRAAVVIVLAGLVAASAAAGTWLARAQRGTRPPVIVYGTDTPLPFEPPSLRVETEALGRGQISIFASNAEGSRSDPASAAERLATPVPEKPLFLPPPRQLLPSESQMEWPPVDAAPAPVAVATSGPVATSPPVVNDAALVREVLDRYAAAYSRLDVDAASAAWPGVNRSALARAFDGLASQRVSLGSCDVLVNGAAARAACHGTATWRPKVGGGEQTDARAWTFDLAKAPGGWQIVDARVQNR